MSESLVQREALEAARCDALDLRCGQCVWCGVQSAFRDLDMPWSPR